MMILAGNDDLLTCFYRLFCIFSSRPVRFGLALPYRERDDNKENSKPNHAPDPSKDDDSEDDGPVLYREDEDESSKEDPGKGSLSI
jgi:hypothetical protein